MSIKCTIKTDSVCDLCEQQGKHIVFTSTYYCSLIVCKKCIQDGREILKDAES